MSYSGTQFVTASDQTVKIWSKLLMHQVLKSTYYGKFSGSDPNNIIQVLTDLRKGPGDVIKYDLLQQDAGYGATADTAITDTAYESALAYKQDSVAIEQRRLAKAWTRMSQQRTIHQLRMDAMRNLGDAWARIMDQFMFAFLCGTEGADTDLGTALAASGQDVQDITDADHLIDHSGDSPIATFTTDFIDEARWQAETIDYPLQKLRVDGDEVYVMFLHPYQAKNLMATSNWKNAMQNAGPRDLKKNPIFAGSLGMWNGVVLHAAPYLPASASDKKHAILCGKQAGVVAFGNALDSLDQEKYGGDFVFQWVERTETDYNNIKGISASAVLGIKRCDFDIVGGTTGTEPHGVIRVDSTDTLTD